MTEQRTLANTAGAPMNGRKIAVTPSAYAYPLLIKQLLHTPLAQTAHQEIVYRDVRRLTYLELRDRIGRLASALQKIGVRPGDSVGVLDWDSNRFLEAFFAIPMMGVVLQTVNVRLSPEQIAYTIDHAGSSTLLVNDEFVDLVQSILPQLSKVKRLVVLTDRKAPATGKLEFVGEYEELLAAASPDFEFPDFDENVQATTFYTTGTTGLPKGVYYSHRQLVLHAIAELAMFGLAAKQGRFHRDDVYMPITPMFHVHAWGFPWAATLAGVKQVYPGRYDPALLIRLIKTEGVTFTHGVPTLLQMLLDAAAKANVDLAGLKMVIGGSALPKALAKQAMDRGVDVFAGYGMSETGPLLTVAHLKSSDLSGDPDQEVELRTRAGRACPLVDLRIVDAEYEGSASRRRNIRRNRRARALADQWLLQQSRRLRAAMGRRLPAHQRHRSDHARWRSAGYRSHQGRHQDRRRMDLLAPARRHHHASRRRGGMRGDRRQRRPMGRTAACAHRARSEDHAAGERGGHQGSRPLLQRKGRDLEIRRSAENPVR